MEITENQQTVNILVTGPVFFRSRLLTKIAIGVATGHPGGGCSSAPAGLTGPAA